MMRMALFMGSILLLTACHESLSLQERETRGQEVVKLFTQSCVASDGHAAQVHAWATAQKATAMSADDIQALPFGLVELDAQNVWKLDKEGAAYYLTLTPSSCSVKVEQADENTVRTQFIAMVEQGKMGLNVELRADNATQTPFPYRQLAYAWRAAGSGEEMVLTANTSPSEQLPAQAALSLTHQSYVGGKVVSNIQP